MNKFRIGDVVRLNSGSPNLTVTGTTPSKIYVKWTDDTGAVQNDHFPEACLTLIQGLTIEVKGISGYDRQQLNG